MFIRGGPCGPNRLVLIVACVEGLKVVSVPKGGSFVVLESGGFIVDIWLSHGEGSRVTNKTYDFHKLQLFWASTPTYVAH
jgi:hypothetical protein